MLRSLIARRNVLLRYREISELWAQHKEADIPTTYILRKFIFPRYFISYRTLMNILGLNIDKELGEIEEKIRHIRMGKEIIEFKQLYERSYSSQRVNRY